MAPYNVSKLPTPGEIVHLDFRGQEQHGQRQQFGYTVPLTAQRLNSGENEQKPLKVIQWNIERGYKLQKIIQELARVDADILCLQELDIGCERSGFMDVGKEIASALHLNYVFVCEFEEIHSNLRSPLSQGGGVHGNAIMTKFNLTNAHAVLHEHDPVNWENPTHPYAKLEPRKGRRATMAATVQTPSNQQIMVYSAHLELYCGILSRVRQFSEILRDAKAWIEKGVTRQIIGGDLNTMGHGLARLSPYYCMDKMRYKTLGQSEARWWEQNVLMERAEPGRKYNAKLVELGLSVEVAKDALNPGFWDPWDVDSESTLDIFWFFNTLHLVKGKLDWLFLRGQLAVMDKRLGNNDYSASDHKWLLVNMTTQGKGPDAV